MRFGSLPNIPKAISYPPPTVQENSIVTVVKKDEARKDMQEA